MKTLYIRQALQLFVVESAKGWLLSVQICLQRFLVLMLLLLGVFPLYVMKNKQYQLLTIAN